MQWILVSVALKKCYVSSDAQCIQISEDSQGLTTFWQSPEISFISLILHPNQRPESIPTLEVLYMMWSDTYWMRERKVRSTCDWDADSDMTEKNPSSSVTLFSFNARSLIMVKKPRAHCSDASRPRFIYTSVSFSICGWVKCHWKDCCIFAPLKVGCVLFWQF